METTLGGATAPAAAPTGSPYGEIFDRGYKHYDGPRLGRRHAIWALIVYSMKRALGIKKGWGAKIIPILLYVGISLPVIVSLGIRAFAPNVRVLDYPAFFAFVFIIEGIFVATIAPEMLCGDRRENVLPLYFARALSRIDYLFAKLVAAALLTLTVSFVPAAILWLGRQFLEKSPLTAMRQHAGDLGRIALAGGLIAFYLGALGLLVSSFTGRKSIAIAIIIIGFLVAEALAGALFVALGRGSDVRDYVAFLSPISTVASFVTGLFHVTDGDRNPFPTWVYGTEMAGVVAVCCLVMYWRYVPNE